MKSSGRDEVYVRPFPDVEGGRWQVSTDGGRTPVWAHNGRALFYRSPDKAVMAVQIEPGSAWRSGPPTQMLPARYFDNSGTTGRSFDVTADGQRFLMIKEGGGDDTSPPQAVVVQNWTEELKRLVPAR